MLSTIEQILDELRPTLELDGGGVELLKYENKDLHLALQGACSGCPMAGVTFGMVLEKRLRDECGDQLNNIYYSEV